MQQWSILNNSIAWILPLHVCGSWLASSSSVFEKLPGRQPLKRLSLIIIDYHCQAANLWKDHFHYQSPYVANLDCHFCDQISTPFNIHLHVQSYGHPNTKKIMTNSTFSTATYLSRCHPRATSRWCPCTTVFPGHELPATKESDLWLWSQFERVLLEQYCFIKFKSFPHLRIVEKRTYSAPELCVYKLPSALPLKL